MHVLEALALRRVEPSRQGPPPGGHPWLPAIRLLMDGRPQEARRRLESSAPRHALEAYWAARIQSTCRRHRAAEHLLQTGRDLLAAAAQPGEGDRRSTWLWLLKLEQARQQSFRYQHSEAMHGLEDLLAEEGLPTALRAQVLSLVADIRVNDPRGELASSTTAPTAEDALRLALRLGRRLAPGFRLEQVRKTCDLLQRNARWGDLARCLPGPAAEARLPLFHRAFFMRCRLQLAWDGDRPGLLPMPEEEALALALSNRPLHAPGLLHVAAIKRLAVRRGLRRLDWERRGLDRLMRRLHQVDGLGTDQLDWLDWLDRGLYEHARPLYQRHADLWLSPGLAPRRQAPEQRLHHALTEAEHPCNRHVLDLVAKPHLQEQLLAILLGSQPERELDQGTVHVQEPPRLPEYSVLAAGCPAFVRLIQGEREWHLIRTAPGGGALEHRTLAADWINDSSLSSRGRLGQLMFEGYPAGETIHVIADGQAEDIAWHALPHGDGLWGGRLLILECPNLNWLFRPLSSSVEPPSRRTGPPADFASVEAVTRFFRKPSQAGIWLLSGHGESHPQQPHRSMIKHNQADAGLDVGDLFAQAAGCRLVVLDCCHSGSVQDPCTENDLGPAMAALLGGARIVLAYRRRVGASGPLRKQLLETLFYRLSRGVAPSEAVRQTLDQMSSQGLGGTPLHQGESIRLLGALTPEPSTTAP
ncbi:MAG: CHAT domain-containing protein [bacterium]|nr:CHAT domain-containing protein [bacterium]